MKLRPVDQLRKLLEDGHGTDSEMLKAYFTVHGVMEIHDVCFLDLYITCLSYIFLSIKYKDCLIS